MKTSGVGERAFHAYTPLPGRFAWAGACCARKAVRQEGRYFGREVAKRILTMNLLVRDLYRTDVPQAPPRGALGGLLVATGDPHDGA
jgi:hypothetical protein